MGGGREKHRAVVSVCKVWFMDLTFGEVTAQSNEQRNIIHFIQNGVM